MLGLLVLCVCPNTTDDVASINGAVEAATQPYHLAYFLTHMERQDHGERKKGDWWPEMGVSDNKCHSGFL